MSTPKFSFPITVNFERATEHKYPSMIVVSGSVEFNGSLLSTQHCFLPSTVKDIFEYDFLNDVVHIKDKELFDNVIGNQMKFEVARYVADALEVHLPNGGIDE